MHEISIADGILCRALEAAANHDAERIDALTIEVGRATHVNPEQVVFCLEALAEDTLAASATIHTETIEPVARCECGWEATPADLDLAAGFAPDVRCPECGEQADLVQGRECRLASVEIPEDVSSTDRPTSRQPEPEPGHQP